MAMELFISVWQHRNVGKDKSYETIGNIPVMVWNLFKLKTLSLGSNLYSTGLNISSYLYNQTVKQYVSSCQAFLNTKLGQFWTVIRLSKAELSGRFVTKRTLMTSDQIQSA